MSLINQMLKDLEQRGAGSTKGTKLSSSSFNVSSPQSTPFPFFRIIIIASLLTGGVYSWFELSNANSHHVTSEANSAVSTENNLLAPTPPAQANITPAPTVTLPKANLYKTKAVSLFETELSYKPIETQYQPKKTQKDLTESVSATKKDAIQAVNKPSTTNVPPSNNANNPANNSEPEKAPALKQTLSRLSTKLSGDTSASGKEIRPDQKSGNYYRQGLSNLQQGRVSEAQANLVQALEANPANQEARQTLAGLLIDNKRNDEAKAVLTAGLEITPEQSHFRMALARLQVESGDRTVALSTLEQGLPYAKTNADYQSFIATLLQRADRHDEAITHYMTALSLNSNTTSTLIGLGISLQAVGKLENAKETFMRAQSSTALTPELSAFVEQRLKQINQRLRN